MEIYPGALIYEDAATKKSVYTVWMTNLTKGGSRSVYTSESPSGPFVLATANLPAECSINASRLLHAGTFYCTGQKGTSIMTAPSIAGPWEAYSTIEKVTGYGGGEDPFIWVDTRNAWHILFHAADGSQLASCTSSQVSAHYFSNETWHALSGPTVAPYQPRVAWSDGMTTEYSSVERPHAYFDAQTGAMTHLSVAAELAYGNGGCPLAPCGPARLGQCPCVRSGPNQGHCACANCKYVGHAGTVLIALELEGA